MSLFWLVRHFAWQKPVAVDDSQNPCFRANNAVDDAERMYEKFADILSTVFWSDRPETRVVDSLIGTRQDTLANHVRVPGTLRSDVVVNSENMGHRLDAGSTGEAFIGVATPPPRLALQYTGNRAINSSTVDLPALRKTAAKVL